MSSSPLLRLEPAPSSPGSIAAFSGSSGDEVTLRISGGKPIHMKAELLAQCSSWSPGAPAWHELVLYHSDTASYAAGIRSCRGPMGGNDVFHARIFADLDGALAWVQAFSPTADLGADIDSSDRRISTTDIALKAATLRQHADRVEQQYSVMIGELLYRIDVGE